MATITELNAAVVELTDAINILVPAIAALKLNQIDPVASQTTVDSIKAATATVLDAATS